MTAAAPEEAGLIGARGMEAAVTGIGVVAPGGVGTERWWAAVLRGENAIGPVTRFDASGYPASLAGEVTGFVDEDHVASRLLPQTDRVTRLSLAAAAEALDDAGLDPARLPDYAVGVVTANGTGGFEFGQRELQALWSKGSRHVGAYQSFAWFYAANSGQISIRHGLRGPSGVIVSEQAGGLDAVAQARRQLRKGIRAVVTGGVDSALCPWGWTAQLADGGLSTGDDPDRAYLPFDAEASGHVPGEGGALLVLEDGDAARGRGATVHGTIAAAPPRSTRRPAPGRPGCGPPPNWPWRMPGSPRARSMSSSQTRRASGTPTGPRQRRWPRCSARTVCRSPRPSR